MTATNAATLRKAGTPRFVPVQPGHFQSGSGTGIIGRLVEALMNRKTRIVLLLFGLAVGCSQVACRSSAPGVPKSLSSTDAARSAVAFVPDSGSVESDWSCENIASFAFPMAVDQRHGPTPKDVDLLCRFIQIEKSPCSQVETIAAALSHDSRCRLARMAALEAGYWITGKRWTNLDTAPTEKMLKWMTARYRERYLSHCPACDPGRAVSVRGSPSAPIQLCLAVDLSKPAESVEDAVLLIARRNPSDVAVKVQHRWSGVATDAGAVSVGVLYASAKQGLFEEMRDHLRVVQRSERSTPNDVAQRAATLNGIDYEKLRQGFSRPQAPIAPPSTQERGSLQEAALCIGDRLQRLPLVTWIADEAYVQRLAK